jgi:very-short-patch-repair endonuclease
MPELLAAFAMPNDPAVDRILKAASDVLRRAGKRDQIDGYVGKSRTRVWELASALWSAVACQRLSYALPPASFEQQGQKIRTPSAVLDNRIATCLDTALLFAAALEQAGLNALLILTKGHAFVGVWLQPQEFAQLITDEAAAVRKRIDLKELLVFETTLVTQAVPASFSQAVAAAERQITDEDFLMALDLRRARMQRIRPLAFETGVPQPGGEKVITPASDALEEAPSLPGFDVEIVPDATSPAGRLALWRRKLLDLTTRNRLLHLPESAKAVRLVCPDPGRLEDILAEGKRIKVAPMPDLEVAGRDLALYEQQANESLREQYARAALDRGEVLSVLDKSKLDAALVDLYRKARSDLDEGGANTLFLALGFLKWKKSADDPKSYRAPLILLPVKLERKSALSGVTMSLHEDEPSFNLTLLELLRQDFEIKIPGLDGALPTDERGIDVGGTWNIVRRAVRDVPRFEVTGDVVLGTFSFAKYLMWKDLSARAEQLTQNPVVCHLIERASDSFGSGSDFPAPSELDPKIDPSQLFAPLPADSSQLAAVVASAAGHDFVLDGPPGTGKSQTIANMIAHNLALGRRVLFVAEKMAALEVVYRRLEEKGLGEFCLELHSNKTSKVEVLKRLERAWDARDALTAEEWSKEAAEVRRLRDNLNDIVALLHKRWPNGLTVHDAIGRVVRDANAGTPRLIWPDHNQHDEETLARLRDVARRLDLNRVAVRNLPESFGSVGRTEWSNGWQEAFVAAARALPPAIESLSACRESALEAVHLSTRAEQKADIDRLARTLRLLLDAYGVDLSFAFAPDATQRIAAARRALGLLGEYREAERGLSIAYTSDGIRRLNLPQFDAAWAEAGQKFWFLASLAKKKVARNLAEQGGGAGLPDPGRDLPSLHRMRQLLEEMDTLSPGLTGLPGWSALSSDIAHLTRALDLAEGLRTALSGLATSPEHLVELRRTITTLVVDANELLAAGGAIDTATCRLEEALTRFRDAARRFGELGSTDAQACSDLNELRALAAAVSDNQKQLKAWCDWRRVRDEAVALGIKPLVDAIETGALPDGGAVEAFETGYARWFAACAIDAEPKLRNFVPAEHVSDIEAYRRLDDRLSKLAVRYIRAKLCGQIPSKNDVGKKDGFGVLKHELQKQKRHKPVRQLAVEMGEALTRLAPCMLMSPLSIAQYLPPDQALFDLVIFDEASQIAPWDAIGSIARGKQVVIAGDPRQMPPTSFFGRSASGTDDDVEEDMESILDECLGAGIPSHSLSWHYRSRHESLIAFSNHRYYDSNLTTFPAAVTRESAVEWRRVQGVYAKGKGRINQAEAEAMVEEVVRRLTDPVFVPAKRTLAVVTLNSEQQKLVEDLLDRARQRFPQIEPFFAEDLAERVLVKNLETVQGDERDLIILGIGYGPTEPGATTMSMNFGPLNRDGGWRRLNVAVTRARQEMLVFTSFEPSMIDLNRTSARAVQDLKHFLEFADRGPRALAEAVRGSVGGYESPFEEAVAQGLARKGWMVVPQIGVSRFRIDLGIVHPDRPGDYLVGIECDGATYHSAATARDRDKVRSAILQGLGWKLLRVWSTEWWVDKEGALERLHAEITALLERARNETVEASPTADTASIGLEPSPDLEAAQAALGELNAKSAQESVSDVVPAPSTCESIFARAMAIPEADRITYYRPTDFSALDNRIDPSRFHEPDYDQTLTDLIAHTIKYEAPILDTILVQRIARAHGFQRAGRLIRERVLELVKRHHHIRPDPEGSRFIWRDHKAPSDWIHCRLPTPDGPVRQIEEIALEELTAAARGKSADDLPSEIAQLFGVRRLSASARKRLELAFSEESDNGHAQQYPR